MATQAQLEQQIATYTDELDQAQAELAALRSSGGSPDEIAQIENRIQELSAASLEAQSELGSLTLAADPYGTDDTGDEQVENRQPGAVSDYSFGTPYDDDGNLNPGWTLDEDNNPVYVGGDFVEPATSELAAQARAQTNPYRNGTPYDDDGNLNPGWTLDENNNPVFVGGDFVEPATSASATASREAAITQAALARTRSQAAIEAQRKQANEGDWRVKLRLAGGSDYLYNDPGIAQNGILYPLKVTDGVIFPYTPTISTTYGANYSAYDLTHSNYRGYFYQNSYVDEISISATFTAQDTSEANYLLAVIHFFRSVTKMFYGQDAQRGMPPPLVFLQGLGEYQFNLHPCVVKSFNYNLPSDVDYIRARSVKLDGTNLLSRRDRQSTPTSGSGSRLASVIRLLNAGFGGSGLPEGAVTTPQAPPTLGTNSPTYVPTKMEISLSLLPIQTREQVSKQFSLKNFANGNLLKGGFW